MRARTGAPSSGLTPPFSMVKSHHFYQGLLHIGLMCSTWQWKAGKALLNTGWLWWYQQKTKALPKWAPEKKQHVFFSSKTEFIQIFFHPNMGGFHSHGDTSQWMVYDGKTLTKMDENWGYPMTQETSQDVFPPGTSRTGKAGATDSPFLSPQKNRHESQNFVRLCPLEPLETDTVIPWKKMCCFFFQRFWPFDL